MAVETVIPAEYIALSAVQNGEAGLQLIVQLLLFDLLFLAMVLVGLLDFMWQRYRMEERMKMTMEELKREHKETEGDPHVVVVLGDDYVG